MELVLVAQNIIIFGVDHSPSRHLKNPLNNFLISMEEQTDDINESAPEPDQSFSINLILSRFFWTLER